MGSGASRALVRRSTAVPAAPGHQLRHLTAAWLIGYGSENTRAAYGSDLHEWLRWCSGHSVDPFQVARPHVDAWGRTLEAADAAPATVARRLAAVASFYRFLEDEGLVPRSPVERVRRPRVGTETPRLGLTRAEAAAFLEAANAAGARDAALTCLLLVNGLRVSEAIRLELADLGDERGHEVARVRGKGGRIDIVPLPPTTSAAIRAACAGRTTGPVVADADGSPLTRHQAGRIVRRLARAAGITKRVGPHDLRHTAVTLALEAGEPLHRVQDLARHADPRTTRRYDRARHGLDAHASYRLASYLDAST